jgi:predicted nucleotidyltransferase
MKKYKMVSAETDIGKQIDLRGYDIKVVKVEDVIVVKFDIVSRMNYRDIAKVLKEKFKKVVIFLPNTFQYVYFEEIKE